MTVTMMKSVKRRMSTVGMISLMSVHVTPRSSSKLSLLTPDRIEPTSCEQIALLERDRSKFCFAGCLCDEDR